VSAALAASGLALVGLAGATRRVFPQIRRL